MDAKIMQRRDINTLSDSEVADYIHALDILRQRWQRPVPAALITADRDPTLRAQARAHQVELLHKPLKPAALRALLRMRERVAP